MPDEVAVQYGPEVLADLAAALRAALSRWGLSGEADLTLLNVSENATFRASDADRSIIVRVHRLGYHEPDEIRSEIAWIDALRHDGVVDTPEPLRGRDGDPLQTLPSTCGRPSRQAVAFALAPGAEPGSADRFALFHRLGAISARLHRHATAWPRPARFRRKIWDFEAMFGGRPLWGDWRAAVGLDVAGEAVIGRALALIRGRLERFGRGPERFGLIHADLRLANLLVEGTHLRVIDFDDCGFCWHLYDFAAAVSFFEDEPIVDALRETWVAGYRSVAPLPAEDAAELPVFVAMRRFLLTAWIASHPEVPVARELGAGYTRGSVAMAERLLSTFD